MLNKALASMAEAPAQGIDRAREQKGRKKACPPHVCELRTPAVILGYRKLLWWKAWWRTKTASLGKGGL